MTEVADASWAAYDLPLAEPARSDAAAASPALAEDDERLLLQNVAWFCRCGGW